MRNILIILIILSWVGISSAESGTIVISDDQTLSYTVAAGTEGTVDYSHIRFDNANYNYLGSFHFHPEGAETYALPFESTLCTIVSGATSSFCYADYDRNSSTIHYWFGGNMLVTSDLIVLNFQKNIFANVTAHAPPYWSSLDGVPTSVNPVAISVNTDSRKLSGVYDDVVVATRGTDYYSVSYLPDNLFTVSVTKNPYVNTKYFINGQNSRYSEESTFNKVNITNALFTYNDGLYLNATLSTGIFTNVLVNSSGVPGFIPPGQAPSDNINPLTGVGIVFDASDYAIGDIANISWIRTSATPFTYTDYVIITYPTGTLETLLSSPPNSGNVLFLLDKPGTYKVSFIRSGIFGDQTVLDSDESVVGSETPSYIVAPSQVAIGKLFNATYKIGWTLSQGSTAWIRTYHWDTVLGQWEQTYQSFAVTGVKDVQTNASILVTKQGDYMISLCDVLQGCKASTNTEAVFNGSEVTTTITTSNITIDKTTYSYGETVLVKTAVDNYNWSNKQIVVDYIDYGMGITQNQQYIQSQIESFPLYISDLTFSGSGASGLRLIGKNDTGEYTLAHVNFTLSATDSEGYGLTYTGNSSCVGSTIKINAIVPAGELANLSISADDARFNKEYVINGSKIISYTIKAPGTYYLVIRKDGEARRMIIFNTASCQAAVTPGAIGGAGQTSNQISGMLTSNMFWALIFSVGLMGFIAYKTKDGLPTAIGGMMSIGVFTWMTWIPAVIFYSVLIIAAAVYLAPAIAAKFFNTGGGQK